ncbi:MAG: septum formation initiator family protein [Clostridiaceae bacterium]|nr:septum formation initiator family protein [Clostridiaceae bacterium]
MRKTKEKKRHGIKYILKKIIYFASAIYVVYILIQQQIILNSYKEQKNYYIQQIKEEEAKAEQLKRLSLLYSTDMYIERIARDKLGLVKSNEKVFIDITDQ